MTTQFQKIEQEMKGLATELATLRLPHKLNQYRVYERKLRSVEKQIKEVAESDDDNLQKRLEAELTQLQSTLDRAVLCGVSQCFICGGSAGNADLQLGSPKKFPITTVATYSRSVSAHANYANNFQQRGKLPFENGSSSSSSNRQYGTQISYHGKVGNNVAAEKGVSSPPPDIVPTLSSSPQPVTSSPSPSLSPSISLTPSPSPSPTPSSPAPTASPLQFEGDEKEKETSNDTSAAKEVVIPLENGKSSNENVGKGTAVEVVLSTPEKTTTTTTTTTTTKISTPPASPKIARTASPSPSKPSTPPPPPPPPPPLSPKPQRRSPSPSNFVKGLLKYYFLESFLLKF